jgi:S-formylglutathione hydrolase FrmB
VKEYVGTSVALNGTTRLRVILPTGYAENPTRRADDYRSWVDATCRTKPQRSERAIAGLSMGGHGTAAYSGRHSDLFAAAEAFSGVVNPLALGPGENVFGPKTPENIAPRVGGRPGHAHVAVLGTQPAPCAAGVPARLRR